MSNNLRCGRGFSVIELLVGFALFAALVVAVAEGMRLYIATNKHVKVQEQVLDVRANLRGRLNCEKTLAPILAASQCDGSQYVNVKDGNNAVIVLANGSAKIGDYKIRSRCQKLGGFYGIVSDYLRVGPTGDAVKDPLKGTVTDWKQMSKVPIACLPQADCSPIEEGRSVLLNGSGTAASPFRICTLAHLDQMRGNVTASYKIMKDIDAIPMSAGLGWLPIPNLTGSLDGNGKTISGLKSHRPTENEVGLFRSLRAPVKDLTLANCSVQALTIAGCLASIASSTLTRITITGRAEANPGSSATAFAYAGLVAGYFTGTADFITVSGVVTAKGDTHTMAGLVFASMVAITSLLDRASATGTVTTTSGTHSYAGGVVGRIDDGAKIDRATTDRTNAIHALVNSGTGAAAGGVAGGASRATVTRSLGAGNITATATSSTGAFAGGVIGFASESTVNEVTTLSTNAISSSMNTSSNVASGGVFGRADDCTVSLATGLGSVTATATGGLTTRAGGVIGEHRRGVLSRSVGRANVSAVGNGASAGGLTGAIRGPSCRIEDSYATGTISATSTSAFNAAGGLIGTMDGVGVCYVRRSYSTGTVTANKGLIGGLVGFLNQTSLENVFTTSPASIGGSTIVSSVGGLIGRTGTAPTSGSFVANSFWLAQATSSTVCSFNTPALCTSAPAIANFYSSSALQTNAMFATWDFTTIWQFPGGGLPTLR